jgi:hypothetical protein
MGTTVRSPYVVTVSLRAGDGKPPVVVVAEYASPGTYALTMPVPRTRTRGAVHLKMMDARVRPLPPSTQESVPRHRFSATVS